jgi:folate-binding protein YgfZ
MPLQDDYAAIRERVAQGAISPRSQIAVAGNERASYLQGLLTNDVQALAPGTGCYAAWLTPQGRMLTDMHVLESGGMILLDVPADQAVSTLERLEQFIFTEDVRVGSLADVLTGVWIHGPRAAEALQRALESTQGLGDWPIYRHAQIEFRGEPVSVARIDQVGVPGYCVYVERARAPILIDALRDAGAVAAGRDALEAARIEAGYPVFGVDMSETTIPLEAGIEDRAISFSKGCYVGQEVIIRVLHRGGGRVAKKLVALRVGPPDAGPRTGQGVPARGAKVFSGDREVGEVTSAAESPRFGPIALAYVHRDFVAPETQLQVATADGRTPATVSARPIPSAA